MIAADDPIAVEATHVVQAGDLERLAELLRQHPSLANAHIGTCPDGMSRTLLHAATDWPGHYPNNPQATVSGDGYHCPWCGARLSGTPGILSAHGDWLAVPRAAAQGGRN